MIRTLQKKFVITAMIAVSVLLLAVLGALNVFNTVSYIRQTEALLDDLGRQSMVPFEEGEGNNPPPDGLAPDGSHPPAEEPAENRPPKDGGPASEPIPPEQKEQRTGLLRAEPVDDNARMSALYFTVELDEQCNILRVDTSHIASISEDEASEMALGLDVDQEKGSLNSYQYKIFVPPEGGYKVVFLDSTSRRFSVMRVFLLSVLIGSISWLLMLGLVVVLSRRYIRPIAENMHRQRQFVTDAGHELKTPLAIITANVEAMELRAGENKYSRNIRSQAVRLSELVKNLLTLARVDEYSILEKPEIINFSDLCSELFPTFREPAELKQIRYYVNIEDGLTVRGDRNLLSQLCSILADNAVKYCPDSGEIQVLVQQHARRVFLRISNTVTEAPEVDKLFDRFYRADSSRNQKSGGFGIGLSAAQTISHLHGAELTADYDESSSMLSFTVQFPP